MKFSSEFEMCKHVTGIISGLLVPIKHKHIPEVPRASHNNHADMLFLLNSGTMFIVEYKLNNPFALLQQVQFNDMAIGIVNQNVTKEFYEKYRNNRSYRIFSYTGKDSEIEKIFNWLINKNYFSDKKKKKIYGNHYKTGKGIEAIYYWGYKKAGSSFVGGLKNCKRLSLYQLYIQAVQNLQGHYNWQLDFYLVHSVLRFYAPTTAKKHFNIAMEQKNEK